MTTHSVLLSFALLALSASFASAQGVANWCSGDKGLETLLDPGAPSSEETRYLEELERRLGKRSQAARIRVPYGPSDLAPGAGRRAAKPPTRSLEAEGLLIEVGGLEIRRLNFPTRTHAQLFAIYGAKTLGRPTLVETRGYQVVVARGSRVAEPTELEKIRSAAWSVMPCAPGAPTVVGVTLSRSTHTFQTRVPNQDLDSFVAGALKEARSSPGRHDVVRGQTALQMWKGHTSFVERLEEGSTLWVSGSHMGLEAKPKIRSLAEVLRRGSAERDAAKAKLTGF
jgi:hypothetical protein